MLVTENIAKRRGYETYKKNMRTSILKKRNLIFESAVGLILSVVFLASVSAQNKVVTEDEVKTILSNAEQKLKKISYRSVTTEKGRGYEKTTIYEFVPPNREHFIIKEVITRTNIKKYDEWIYIGKQIYYRSDENEEWEKFVPDSNVGVGYGTGTGMSSSNPNVITEYKLTPNQIVNQQASDLYEVIISVKNSGSSKPDLFHYKHWINKKGLFVETLYTDSQLERTVDYDYDWTIKIAAPTIKKRTNKGK